MKLRSVHRRISGPAGTVAAGIVLAAGLALAAAPSASAAPSAAPGGPVDGQLSANPLHLYKMAGNTFTCLDTPVRNAVLGDCPEVAGPTSQVPESMAWEYPSVDNYKSVYVKIENLHGDCLGILGSSKAQGARAVQTSCADTASREWDPVKVTLSAGVGASIYELVNRNSGLCLTDDHGSLKNGNEINQSKCTKAAAMLWWRPRFFQI